MPVVFTAGARRGWRSRGTRMLCRFISMLFVGGLSLAPTVALAAKEVTYYYSDPAGTVLATTDAAGNLTGSQESTPYGTVLGDIAVGNVRYAGGVLDGAPGYVYMAARYYDPELGRFISADPILPGVGNVFNFNRFAYANNNPLSNIDRTGMACGAVGEVSAPVQRMRDASDGCNNQPVGNDGGISLPISAAERAAAAGGNRALFWSLRYHRSPRDPWSADGMALWNPSGLDNSWASTQMKALAWVNIQRLNDAIALRDGTWSLFSDNVNQTELNSIGNDVMNQYVRQVDRNRGTIPTLTQSADFHYQVFAAHRLPSGTYGGTPFGYGSTGLGKSWGDFQAKATNAIFSYCTPGCQP